jgi:hypothetical protein
LDATQPAPLLSYRYILDDPPRVHQTVCLYDDGQAWYWATLPGARTGIGAGTYVFTLDAGALAHAHSLSETLATLPATPSTPVFNVTVVTVTAYSGGVPRTHQLGFAPVHDLPAPLVQAYDLGESLVAQAEREPLAVASLACTAAMGPGDRAILRFTLTNSGAQAVTFLLQPRSFTLQARRNDEWQGYWQHRGGDQIGLIGPSGDLVDGFILPATLAPGDAASVVFLEALEGDIPGPVSLRGQVEGTISLLRRDEAPPIFPGDPFRLVTAPVALTRAGESPAT